MIRKTRKEAAFVAWVKYFRRSELLAEQLNAKLHFVQYGREGMLIAAPIRYVLQALKTCKILAEEMPETVLVQNPPIFLALIAFLYGRLCGARFIIDSHTSAFLSPRWTWSLWLHRMLSRRALITLVHNESQEQTVKRWRCPYAVVGDPITDYPRGRPYPVAGQFNVAVVCSFQPDEPIRTMLEGAARLPDVDFYFTGDPVGLPRPVLEKRPTNCHLTGYLPYPHYIGLLRCSDVVMSLITSDHTLLCGAFEAVSLGVPLIVSDWPILKARFSAGTVHVPNTVEGIQQGVRRAMRHQDTLRREIRLLRKELRTEWQQNLEMLQALIEDGSTSGRGHVISLER